MTPEEQVLLDSYYQYMVGPSSLEAEIELRRLAGEKIKLASKRQLRKAAVAKYLEAFGSQCVDMKLGEEWDPLFDMKCCGWIISTQLYFGRQKPIVSYRHRIISEARITHPENPEITGPAMTLSRSVAWLVNQWEDVFPEEVDAVCSELVKQSGWFFEVAPRLLSGLECDKLVP